ncbi:translocation/assembly module TamB domain-containing protein [uncultured Sunxiuqinia sp.]|uniref:translocation/assembly module TamB domain-containing protein n=1 Tax=uncultured Sunxiuqinia sp. TaxID=1573825 RepID=UPI00261A997E|nr:translocation/assembly module TamB domain-containing protein [uncultured Sunxiuqinia sp.]
MRKVIRYSLRLLGYFFLIILLLVLLAGLLIQPRPVKQKLARVAGEQVSAVLNGQLSIGRLEGNYFTNLRLEKILLLQEQDTVAFIEELSLDYSLWPLLNQQLQVHQIRISQPYFYLKQEADSSWNVQHLAKPTAEEADTDTTSSSSAFSVEIARFDLVDARIQIDAADTIIPRSIDQLNAGLSLTFSSEKQQLNLSQLSFKTQSPSLELQQLAFQLNRNSETTSLRNLRIKTARNQLSGQGRLAEKTSKEGSVQLTTEPLNLQEFEFLLPGLNLPASPVFSLDASMEEGGGTASLELLDGKQQIHLDVHAPNLGAFLFEQADVPLEYELESQLTQLDLAYWLGEAFANYLIDGQLRLNGRGTDPKTAQVELDGQFNDLLLAGHSLADLSFGFELNGGHLRGRMQGEGAFGSFQLQPDIRHLLDEPVYGIGLQVTHLNLAPLAGNDSLQSDLNLTAQLEGRGFDPKKMQVQGRIAMQPSSFQSMQLDSLLAELTYENENVLIDSLVFNIDEMQLTARGNYSLNAASDLLLAVSFDGLNGLKSYLPVDSLFASGQLQAHLWGMPDSLNLESTLEVNNTLYQTINLKRLEVDARGVLSKADTTVQASVRAYQLTQDQLQVDSLTLDARATPDSVWVDGRVVAEKLISGWQAGVKLGDQLRLSLADWWIDFGEEHWSLQNAPTLFEMDSVNYRLNSFKMASDASDSSQYVMAQGQISRQGEEDFTLDIGNIDLTRLLALVDQEVPASGTIQAKLKVSGTADAPLLQGQFGLENALLNDYRFTQFGGSFNYAQNLLGMEVQLVPQDSGTIAFTGSVPLGLRLDSMTVDFSSKEAVQAKLTIDKFPLAILQTLDFGQEIAGYIEGRVDAKGTLESPDLRGGLQLQNASLRMPDYGVDYPEIRFGIKFEEEEVLLDTLLIRSKDGKLTGSGQIGFSSDFYKGDIRDSRVKLLFDRFNPVNHKQFNMQVSGQASLEGNKEDVQFDGDLNIPKSELYLPAIFNLMGKMTEPELPQPILMRELERMEQTKSDSLPTAVVDFQPKDTLSFDYFDNLTGEVRLKIPKNTWIKSEDMHIELSGDLKMIKHRDFFELFGTVDVVRGQYDLFGRTFMIESGTISFQGGEELMPQMNITANYVFRNAERIQQKLQVVISGTAEEPAVNFTLDGSSITEGDALSYILFGRSMNELTMDQQENVSGAGNMAGQAAASILSSQLTNFLGNKLNVDYIEVKSEGNFENATVVVGKYLTNDLFVSYEQRFGETNQKDMAKYEVRLEYELFRFLFFQLNNSSNDSGFDMIFKFTGE